MPQPNGKPDDAAAADLLAARAALCGDISESQVKSMTVKDLKAELQSRGLPVSGLKAELISRLSQTVAQFWKEVEVP